MPEPRKPKGSCKSPEEGEKPRSRWLGVGAARPRVAPAARVGAGPAHRPGLRAGRQNKAIPLNRNLSQASPCVGAAALSISALDIMALGGNINNNPAIRLHTILKEPTQCYFNTLKPLSPRSPSAAPLPRCLQTHFTFGRICADEKSRHLARRGWEVITFVLEIYFSRYFSIK